MRSASTAIFWTEQIPFLQYVLDSADYGLTQVGSTRHSGPSAMNANIDEIEIRHRTSRHSPLEYLLRLSVRTEQLSSLGPSEAISAGAGISGLLVEVGQRLHNVTILRRLDVITAATQRKELAFKFLQSRNALFNTADVAIKKVIHPAACGL